MSASVLVALTTFPTAQAARDCVRDLVDRGLVACGTVVPGGTSIYRWEGAVETAEEALLVLKLTADCWEAVEARVLELHPYDVPELVAFPVTRGHAPYLEWVTDVARRP